MANRTIADYSAANSIDPINDYFLIEPSGDTIYNKINRNTILGVTGTPADISTVQTLTNKVIGNTNTITVKDTLLTIQDNSDTTKQAKFELSGITTATTRTYTLPDATTTLVGTGATQTLTNKTITSPTISGGTIDNSTITVDSISGHTSATIVTVANMQISNGVINSANAVTATSIAAGGVQPQALQSGTGSGWSWQSYVPTFTNLTVGNGTLVANYNQTGKTVNVRFSLVFGNTSAVTGSITMLLPVTSVGAYRTDSIIGQTIFNGGIFTNGVVVWASSTTATLQALNVAGTYSVITATSSSVPFTFGTGSVITGQITYEVA